MTVRTILKMGDPRLLRIAPPVERFGTAELRSLVADMFETMRSVNGAGLAAPQIGVDLQLVIFGFDHNERYPDAPPVPRTVLINPTVTPIGNEEEEGWEGCLSVPGYYDKVTRAAKVKARAQNEPRSSIGSPHPTCSRSRMPTRLSPSTTNLPLRKSRWLSTGCATSGACSASQFSASSIVGCGVPAESRMPRATSTRRAIQSAPRLGRKPSAAGACAMVMRCSRASS